MSAASAATVIVGSGTRAGRGEKVLSEDVSSMRLTLTVILLIAVLLVFGPVTAGVLPLNAPYRPVVPSIPPELQETPLTQSGFIEFLGDLAASEGLYREAEHFFERALRLCRKDDFAVGVLYMKLATACGEQGKYAKSERASLNALRLLEGAIGHDDVLTAVVLNNLGWSNVKLGQYARARWFLERAVRISEQASDRKDPIGIASRINLAEVYQRQGNYVRARQLYVKVIVTIEATLGKADPVYQRIRMRVARLDSRLKALEKARLQKIQPKRAL